MHHGGGGGSGGRRAAAAGGGGDGGGSGRGVRDNGPSTHATSAEPASVGTAQPSRALPARSRKPARGFASAASSSRLRWDDVGMSAREAHDLRQALRNSVLIDRMSDGSEAALQEAPTFTPTAAEFADPIEYISSIRSEAQRFGACKIVPPPGWRPQRHAASARGVVPEDMAFEPRLMPIHKLQQGVAFQMAPRTTVAAFREQSEGIKRRFCAQQGIALDEGAAGARSREGSGEEAEADMAAATEAAAAAAAGGGEAGGAAGGEVAPPPPPRAEERRLAAEMRQEDALVRAFWRIVRTECDELVVPYGADLDTSCHRSGFAPGEGGRWNLNRLAAAPGGVLDARLKVAGVTAPWLYVGGFFGAFCWHTEDMWMYSCNHLHEGAPKSWYVVAAEHAAGFERAARSLLATTLREHPDLLEQLVTMVAPSDLVAQGVPVYRITQRPGEFVVTFPRAYHAGFSHGFNVAEAVNFATPDWLPFGRNAVSCYRRHRRTPVVSIERLCVKLALGAMEQLEPSTADWLLPELRALVTAELKEREAALPVRYVLTLGHRPSKPTAGELLVSRTANPTIHFLKAADRAALAESTRGWSMFDEDALTCFECNRVLFFSGVTCVGGRRAALGPTNGGYKSRQMSAAFVADSTAPLSACLAHAKALRRHLDNAANDANDGEARHEDGAARPDVNLVAWRRHDDAFLRSCCARVAHRAAEYCYE